MSGNGNKIRRKGTALLIVLFIVMAATILSLGFLSRSDVELSCGENMLLCTEMDYLAESGLEHAKGLILSPQDVASEYWPGDVGQQLSSGSDYYDVSVVQHDPCVGPTYRCNYDITSEAYRDKDGERIGRRVLKAELRLDPCIALWTDTNTAVSNRVTINGDVYCNGTLINNGVINGDVFAKGLRGAIAGQQKAVAALSLGWPRVTVADFTSRYPTVVVGGSISSETFGLSNPVRVCYCDGDLELAGGVVINGMLVVGGDLTIRGNGNDITAEKNLPALLVTGDMVIDDGGELDICGLAVVNGQMQISGGAGGVSIVGGLFVKDGIVETTADSSGNSNSGILYSGPSWRPLGGQIGGGLDFNGDDTGVEISTSGMDCQQGTVCLWARADCFDGSHHYLFGHTSQSGMWVDRIQLYTNGGNGWLDLGLGDAHDRDTGIQNLETGRWYHIALTWDGGWYVVYVDGQARASGSYTGLSTMGTVADIGNDGNPAYRDESFCGIIDDVRIYNRGLDVNDVNDIRQHVGEPSGLVGHWKLDGGGGDITITAAPSKTAIVTWSERGVSEKWGQAAGAFFRSIKRN